MGFLEDLQTGVRIATCSYLNSVERASAYGNGIYSLVGAGSPAAGAVNNIARTGIGIFCDTPPVDPAPSGLPIGQCPVNYIIGVREAGVPDGGSPSFQGEATGVHKGPFKNFRRQVSPNGQQWEWLVDGADQNDIFLGAVFQFSFPDPQGEFTARRQDGLPDDCGTDGPGGPPPSIGDRTVDIDIGGDVGQLVIGLGGITVAGDLVAPITINGSNFELSGTINFNRNEINFNFGGADPENNKCCEGPPQTDNPPDEPDPPTEEDTEPADIVGVLVTIDSIDLNNVATTIFQADNPDIYAPNVGYVNFRIKLGDSYGWSVDYPVKNNRHFIPVPEGFQATRIAGTPRQGVAWTLTPVKGLAEIIEIQ